MRVHAAIAWEHRGWDVFFRERVWQVSRTVREGSAKKEKVNCARVFLCGKNYTGQQSSLGRGFCLMKFCGAQGLQARPARQCANCKHSQVFLPNGAADRRRCRRRWLGAGKKLTARYAAMRRERDPNTVNVKYLKLNTRKTIIFQGQNLFPRNA